MESPGRDDVTPDSSMPSQEILRGLRRRLYAHPEFSGDERETAAFISARLRDLGLQVEEGVGGYGVVGELEGTLPGPTIAYRAELDALPIQDTIDTPYASVVPGIKHACGHDVHMAIALGLAESLRDAQSRLPGRVAFVFQPAEESLDGANAMIEAGLLRRTRPQAMLALHAFPLPVGKVGVALGSCLAGMEEFRVRFYTPAGNLDDLVVRAIAALEELSTARAPTTTHAFDRMIGEMETGAGLGRTVFLSCWEHTPGSVPVYHLLGLVSMADFGLRPAVHGRIRAVLDDLVARDGASYDLDFTFSNPPLQNHAGLVSEILPAIEEVLGQDNVMRFRDPYPFAHEDLALYARKIPTALVWLGTANPGKGIASILHTADYDVDEDALSVGVKAMSAVLWALLSAGRTPQRLPDSPTAPPGTLPAVPVAPPKE